MDGNASSFSVHIDTLWRFLWDWLPAWRREWNRALPACQAARQRRALGRRQGREALSLSIVKLAQWFRCGAGRRF